MINVGIIGMGKMGILHTGILNSLEDVNISAIAEKDDTLRNYIKGFLKDIKVYDDYKKMINNENIDLAYITTPVTLHAAMAYECINNNVNFFVEKPLAVSLEECEKLYNNNLISVVGYSKRFVDTFVKTKEILDNGVLGDFVYVKGSMYLTQVFKSSKGWRFKKSESGGGILLELASHLIDLLLWYFGSINRVSSILKNYYSKEVEDFVHAIIQFDNLDGYIDASWSVRNYRLPEINIEVHGSNGTMLVNEDYIRLILDAPFNRNNLNFNDGITTIYKQELFKGVPIDIGGVEYTREDMHVIDCVKNKRQSMLNISEASKVQAVIDAIYRSANNNRWEDVRYLA
ncbi:MAG: hypothetical protein KatS3mg003_0302 [Candidatus Nitrosocaldaceae archaeon]|nr:MAG: hypothetical protein KatS3mg003_0302 [Candidatus Nitrosocaldaceae archaeon]